MILLQKLYATYENSLEYIGREDEQGNILLPIGHSTHKAQIEIAIDLEGDFKSANRIEAAHTVTIIPVTEDSGSRSNGSAPHPLFDKLCYIAGDYIDYVSKEKYAKYHHDYIMQLRNWQEKECHPYVRAVYLYLKKKTVIKDLLSVRVLISDTNGGISQKEKIGGVAQMEAFVRFYIQDERVEGTGKIWRCPEVYEDFIRYYLSTKKELALDYITGEIDIYSEKQPSKIRNSKDKAKLISANDSHGFTYRGRFRNRKEALSIGYNSSQKLHNVLKWLIERQGYTKHEMCVLMWNPEGKHVPNVLDDKDEILHIGTEYSKMGQEGDYRCHIYSTLTEYFADINAKTRDVFVLSLEAATPGRLAINYYQEMHGSDFLVYLSDWYATCVWTMTDKKRHMPVLVSPKPEEIVQAAYGVEWDGKIHVDERLFKETLKRLLPCMTEGKHLPCDIVRSAVRNACRPQGFSPYHRRKILEVTCALIYKSYCDKNKTRIATGGVWNLMSLDRTRAERDYLFGRLLAVAHKLEYDTFDDKEKGKRETNALRHMSRMIRHPAKTWLEIEQNLKPYWRKHEPWDHALYEEEIQEICDLFEPNEMTDAKKLGEEFFLGYHCELSALQKKTKREAIQQEGERDGEI